MGRFNNVLRPGVQQREVWAWALYDFANSGYTTVVLTTVFNAYYVAVVAKGKPWATLSLTATLSLSYLLIMFTMPGLGVRADAYAHKKRLLVVSTIGCVLATFGLMLAQPGAVFLALLMLAISNYCYCVGESVISAFLPELAAPHALGRVSGWGWGFGYFGGMLTLGLALLVVTYSQALGMEASYYVPWVMALTAVIFAIAAIPALLFLKERTPPQSIAVGSFYASLLQAWRQTQTSFPDFQRLLICGACYHAGVSVVITLAAVYATEAMGFRMEQTMVMIFVVNITAVIGAVVFGFLQDQIGHKRTLAITLWGWIVMVVLAFLAQSTTLFWVAAAVAGLCMGSSQSAGRAMVGRLAPERRPARFYALWTFAVQLAAVVGPLCYGVITWVFLGQHRLALLATGGFFIAGLIMLRTINFERGIQVAQTVTKAEHSVMPGASH